MCVCFQLVAFVREHVWHKPLSMGYSKRLELTLVSRQEPFILELVNYEVIVKHVCHNVMGGLTPFRALVFYYPTDQNFVHLCFAWPSFEEC